MSSYPETIQTPINTCAQFPVVVDPNGVDGIVNVPGLASVSRLPLPPNTDRCVGLFDTGGNPVSPFMCQPYDGTQGAQLVTDLLPGSTLLDGGVLKVCIFGPQPTTSPQPVVDMFALNIVTDGVETQFSNAPGAVHAPACLSGANVGCLGVAGRFRTTVEFGPVNERELATVSTTGEGSAIFSFNEPGSNDVFVKILDGCRFGDKFWVFAAGTPSDPFDLKVVDTQTDPSRVYEAPPPGSLLPVTVLEIDTCP